MAERALYRILDFMNFLMFLYCLAGGKKYLVSNNWIPLSPRDQQIIP